MRHPSVSATGRRRRLQFAFAPLPLLIALGALLLPAAAAQADAAWTGASSSSNWSDSANWSGGTLPTSSTGTLSFPEPGSCGTCYVGQNDLNGIGATSLVFGNSSNLYQIGGNSITVGSAGVSDSPGGGSVLIGAPLVLSGSQPWVVGSQRNGYDSLTLHGGVTGGPGDALSLSMPNGDLFVDSDMEVGPVSSSGPGGLHIGGPPGSGHPGSVNGSDGQSVAVTGGSLVANPGSTTGPLSIAGSSLLLLGTNPTNTGATSLAVQGAASLGSSTTTRTFINNNGSTPGTDFSQLSATGNLTVAGKLVLGQGLSNNNNTGSCVTLNNGTVATLLTTSGTLSGTFANAPDGATLTMTSAYSCESPAPTVRINYTAHSVTATVVSGTPSSTATKTTLAAPHPAVTNQSVTLSATVTTSGSGTVAPSGTVAFSDNAGTIPGCANQPLSGSGSSATATCSTTFPANGSPQTLSAAFTPTSGSGQTASTSSGQSLTINPATTTTGLTASTTTPAPGASVTYTATVAPAITGPATPSGTVTFFDGSTVITGCSAQPLTNATATCTTAYASTPTTHSISADYTGDANFTGSTSPTTTITPQPPTTTTSTTSTTSTTTTAAPPPPTPTTSTTTTPGTTTTTTTTTSTTTPTTVARPPVAPHLGGRPSGHRPRAVVLSRMSQPHVRWAEPLSRRTLARARRGARLPIGTHFTFRVDTFVLVSFTFRQVLPGREVGRRCLAPERARSSSTARPCHRTRIRGRMLRAERPGVRHVPFNGRVRLPGRGVRHADLPAGHYWLTVVATARGRTRSRTRTLHFTIVSESGTSGSSANCSRRCLPKRVISRHP